MTVSKFKLQRTLERSRTLREDGKQDAWNRHAHVASQAKVTTEEHGPDDERQEAGRELPRDIMSREFRAAQLQVKKMTQTKART